MTVHFPAFFPARFQISLEVIPETTSPFHPEERQRPSEKLMAILPPSPRIASPVSGPPCRSRRVFPELIVSIHHQRKTSLGTIFPAASPTSPRTHGNPTDTRRTGASAANIYNRGSVTVHQPGPVPARRPVHSVEDERSGWTGAYDICSVRSSACSRGCGCACGGFARCSGPPGRRSRVPPRDRGGKGVRGEPRSFAGPPV